MNKLRLIYKIISRIIILFFVCKFATNILSIDVSRPPHQFPPLPVRNEMTVIISDDVSNYEEGLIDRALTDWEVASNGLVRFITIRDDGNYTNKTDDYFANNTLYRTARIRSTISNDILIMFVDHRIGGATLGFTDRMNITRQDVETLYMVYDRIGSDHEYEEVVEHEISHVLLLPHIYDENTLMNPVQDNSAHCITYMDLQLFCSIYLCDAEALSPCHPDGVENCNNSKFHLLE